MKTSIWYHVDEKLPERAGHHLVFTGPTFGGDEGGIGTAYFAGTDTGWRERIAPHSGRANVVYWCDADPWDWYDNPGPQTTPAMQQAWAEVQDALSRYELVKALSYNFEPAT